MKLGTLVLKLAAVGFASAALSVLPAMSAPIQVFSKDLAKAGTGTMTVR